MNYQEAIEHTTNRAERIRKMFVPLWKLAKKRRILNRLADRIWELEDVYTSDIEVEGDGLAFMTIWTGDEGQYELELNNQHTMSNNKWLNDKWIIEKDEAGEWRWTRKAPNGKIVGASTEGYKRKRDCVANAERHGYIEGKSKLAE